MQFEYLLLFATKYQIIIKMREIFFNELKQIFHLCHHTNGFKISSANQNDWQSNGMIGERVEEKEWENVLNEWKFVRIINTCENLTLQNAYTTNPFSTFYFIIIIKICWLVVEQCNIKYLLMQYDGIYSCIVWSFCVDPAINLSH